MEDVLFSLTAAVFGDKIKWKFDIRKIKKWKKSKKLYSLNRFACPF